MAANPEDSAREVQRLLQTGHLARARLILGEMTARAPMSALTHYVKALIETADRDFAAAERSFAAAAAAEPHNAMHRVNFGHALSVAGEFERAREEYERALALEPANTVALQNLVMITDVAADDPLLAKLEQISRAPLDADDFIRVHYALGKCYDDIGDHDRAFASFAAANERQARPYDAAAQTAYMRSIAAIWTPEFLAKRAQKGCESRKPVFVIGLPRTGSTALERRLSERDGVISLGESPAILKMIDAIEKNHPKNLRYPEWCADLPVAGYIGFAKSYLEPLERAHPAAAAFIDKNLVNFHFAGFIRALFARALLIETRRDALDTCLSCYFSNLRFSYANSLSALGHYYRLYAEIMAHWRSVGADILEVRQEDFLTNPDAVLEPLWARMGVSPHAGRSAGGAYINTLSLYQARKPAPAASRRRWRNYESHLGPLIQALGDLAETG